MYSSHERSVNERLCQCVAQLAEIFLFPKHCRLKTKRINNRKGKATVSFKSKHLIKCLVYAYYVHAKYNRVRVITWWFYRSWISCKLLFLFLVSFSLHPFPHRFPQILCSSVKTRRGGKFIRPKIINVWRFHLFIQIKMTRLQGCEICVAFYLVVLSVHAVGASTIGDIRKNQPRNAHICVERARIDRFQNLYDKRERLYDGSIGM